MKVNHLSTESNGYGETTIAIWVELHGGKDVDELIAYLQHAKRFANAWKKHCTKNNKRLAAPRQSSGPLARGQAVA